MRSHEANRRANEADHILTHALGAARKADQDEAATPFANLRTRIEARERACPAKERTLMSSVIQPIQTHRTLSFGLVLAVAVFALITLVPFEYQRTVSYDVTYEGFSGGADWTPAQFASVLQAMGYENIGVSFAVTPSGKRCEFTGLPSRHAVREANALMASAVGFEGEPVVAPVRETVSGSLYAQVKEGLDEGKGDLPTVFSELSFKGKTDAEIKEDIRKRLEARGCTNAEIRVKTLDTALDGEPKREVWIKVGSEADASACLFMNNLDLSDVDLKDMSKSDDEIVRIVKERLARAGAPDVPVSVVTNADGERQIMIGRGGDCK